MAFWLLVSFVMAMYVFFDVNYFVQIIWITLNSLILKVNQNRLGFLEESVRQGICLSTDLDFFMHMNNARFLRECDFGRHQLYLDTSAWKVVHKLGGSCMNSASTIRHRRSLNPFEKFLLKTRVVGWDNNAFYVEQKFVRCRDEFICAVAYVKMSVLKISVQEVVDEMVGQDAESPEIPADVEKWIQFNQLSSNKLKMS